MPVGGGEVARGMVSQAATLIDQLGDLAASVADTELPPSARIVGGGGATLPCLCAAEWIMTRYGFTRRLFGVTTADRGLATWLEGTCDRRLVRRSSNSTKTFAPRINPAPTNAIAVRLRPTAM